MTVVNDERLDFIERLDNLLKMSEGILKTELDSIDEEFKDDEFRNSIEKFMAYGRAIQRNNVIRELLKEIAG